MPKETREVTQYRIYTLVNVVLEEREGKEPIEHSTPVAVFDDKDLALAYQRAAGMHNVQLQAEWAELEPVAANFSLPFNPTFVAPVAAEDIKSEDNAAEAAQ